MIRKQSIITADEAKKARTKHGAAIHHSALINQKTYPMGFIRSLKNSGLTWAEFNTHIFERLVSNKSNTKPVEFSMYEGLINNDDHH